MRQAAADAVGFVEGMSLIVLGEAATKAMDSYPDFANAHA